MESELRKRIGDFVEEFRKISSSTFKIVLKNDISGVISGAILARAFEREHINFSISFVSKLSQRAIKEINLDSSECVFLVGFDGIEGNSIEKKWTGICNSDGCLWSNLKSYSSLCYMFACGLNQENKNLSYLAVTELHYRFKDLSFLEAEGEIVDEAIESGIVEMKVGLKIMGSKTRALHKAIEQSVEPFIIGVSGHEDKALEFLNDINIELKKDGRWRGLIDLKEDETKRLVTNVILRRLGSEKRADNLLGEVYLLKSEPEESAVRDLKEFGTMIHACCRMHSPSTGLGACLLIKGYKMRALSCLNDYKIELINGIELFLKGRKSSEDITERGSVVIVNFKSSINTSVLSDLAGILVEANLYDKNRVIVCMGHALDGNIVSAVDSAVKEGINIDLGGESIEHESEFIENIVKKFESRGAEEIVR